MPGPAPKDPSVRARRNKTATRAVLKAHAGKVPPMPKREAGWHEMTKAWWADVWSSPMSPEWDDSDVHNIHILAMVYDDIWCATTARDRKDAAAEYRQQRKDLGLSPMDRRRLEWTIEQADEATARGEQRRSRPSPPRAGSTRKGAAADPRAHLSSVS